MIGEIATIALLVAAGVIIHQPFITIHENLHRSTANHFGIDAEIEYDHLPFTLFRISGRCHIIGSYERMAEVPWTVWVAICLSPALFAIPTAPIVASVADDQFFTLVWVLYTGPSPSDIKTSITAVRDRPFPLDRPGDAASHRAAEGLSRH